jgi:hypothetical protein
MAAEATHPYAIQTIRPQSVFWKNAVLYRGGVLPQHAEFPNLNPGHRVDCLRYSRNFR